MKVDHHRLVAEFIELVRIDSPSKQERGIANYLKYHLEDLGFEVEEDGAGEAIDGSSGNIICRIPGTVVEAQPIMLTAHMDTVESNIGVMTLLENGVIKTDGTTILGADDKAGVAAIMEALRQLKEKKLPHGPLEIVFTVAEEAGLFGALNLDYTKLKARRGFTFDAGLPVGNIVTKAIGEEDVTIEIFGKEAHAGVNPEDGLNAILVAGQILAKLPMGRVTPEITANIGVIEGGKTTNIVPAYVKMLGEIRAFDQTQIESTLQQWEKVIHETAQAHGAKVEIKHQRVYQPYVLNEDSPTVQMARQAISKLNFEPKLLSRGGGSDTNILNQQGVECVNFGVGVQKNHSKEEFVSVDSLVQSARLVLALITVAGNIQQNVE